MGIHEPIQPIGLKGTAFKSWAEYDRAVRSRLAKFAAAELAAAAFSPPPPIMPEGCELLFCFPAPRVASYRHQRTGEMFVLRRDQGKNTFCELTDLGWQPFGGRA